jgi:hypothetical protein
MSPHPTLLKELLVARHWQKYETFCTEYDRAAAEIDRRLRATQPSRAQYYRWLAGQLKAGLPYPDACRVLEAMFPGHAAEELFRARPIELGVDLESKRRPQRDPRDDEARLLASLIDGGLAASDANPHEHDWGISPDELASWRPPASSASIPPPLSDVADNARDTSSGTARVIARRLVALQQRERISQAELRQLGALAGHIVDLDVRMQLEIETDGWSTITVHQHMLNLTDRAVARFVREMWFEHTKGAPAITPTARTDGRQMAIKPIHNVPSMSKFACQLSPPVQPGETGDIGYVCNGGRFVSDHYWRQSFPRYTRRFTLTLRHRGVSPLVHCGATEELPDGSEVSNANDLVWDHEGDDIVLAHTRDYLQPNQAVTVRWEVTH